MTEVTPLVAELGRVLNYLVLGYFVVLNTTYLFMIILAFGALRTYGRRLRSYHVDEIMAAATAPPITLILPAFNEEATCVDSVRSMLWLRYPNYEVMVVNDGSNDTTLNCLRAAFDLELAARYPTAELPTEAVRGVYRSRIHPKLWVVDKENGGKADSLNVGINYCRTPLFGALDADTLLERDALVRVVRPFLEDDSTIAVGGIVRIVNGCAVRGGVVTEVRMPRSWLARFQVLEYLRAFLYGRVGWDALDVLLIISGAFGLFRRQTVVEAGGYAGDTVGEDMELVVRLHRYAREQKIPARIKFVPDPVAWTECPESLRVLGKQRDRWQRGLAQALRRHQKMLLNPHYGRVGLVAYPYFFFLEMAGPAIEITGYTIFVVSLALNVVSTTFAVAFFMVAFIWGVALSFAAVALEEYSFRRYARMRDLLLLMAFAVFENFGYRQLTSFWRVRGLVSYALGHEGWGKMERRGFKSEQTAAG